VWIPSTKITLLIFYVPDQFKENITLPRGAPAFKPGASKGLSITMHRSMPIIARGSILAENVVVSGVAVIAAPAFHANPQHEPEILLLQDRRLS
jgi:hypothetical protein